MRFGIRLINLAGRKTKCRFDLQIIRSSRKRAGSGNSLSTLKVMDGSRTKGLTDFAGLACTSIAHLRKALIQAGGLQENSKNKIIPPFESEDKLNQAVNSIHELATRIILATAHTTTTLGKPARAEVLILALPSGTQQTKFLQKYANHRSLGSF